MKLSVQVGLYSVYRLTGRDDIPPDIFNDDFFSLTQTGEELSLVCREGRIKSNHSLKEEKNWRLIKVEGPLDFGEIGIIKSISSAIAEKEISIFVVSTYDTDYFIVKADKLSHAVTALKENRFDVD